MTKIYNRKTKEIVEEKSPKGTNFLYNKKTGRIVLKIANKRGISKIAGWYLNKKKSRKYIKNFIIDNNINMDDYPKVEYKSFNDFFSRKIVDGKRTFSKNCIDFCSPADSKLIVYKIGEKNEFIIKGKKYTCESILKDKELASAYNDGYFMVFRLSIDDYHRYSYIDDGELLNRKVIKGKYHTVGSIAFDRFKVYEENQREYEVLKTKNFGDIVVIEVGAMMVGRIVNYQKQKFSRGEEKGYFLFGGSTIVIMVKKDIIKIDKDILDNSKNNIETKVMLGEKVATKIEE